LSQIENLGRKSKSLSKIENFGKNRNLCQKSKILAKIEIFVKNRKFWQKSKSLSKIETLLTWRIGQDWLQKDLGTIRLILRLMVEKIIYHLKLFKKSEKSALKNVKVSFKKTVV